MHPTFSRTSSTLQGHYPFTMVILDKNDWRDKCTYIHIYIYSPQKHTFRPPIGRRIAFVGFNSFSNLHTHMCILICMSTVSYLCPGKVSSTAGISFIQHLLLFHWFDNSLLYFSTSWLLLHTFHICVVQSCQNKDRLMTNWTFEFVTAPVLKRLLF